jgi:hypothetical protein
MKTPSIKTVALSALLLLGTFGILSGCKGTLAPGGAYTASLTNTVGTNVTVTVKQDRLLFDSDASFKVLYNTMDTAFLIEKNNRAYFWGLSHNIKHNLDNIRPKCQAAVNAYGAARAAYIASPSQANADALHTTLNTIQSVLNSVNAIIAQTK